MKPKGVTTQMTALLEYVLMVPLFVLLPRSVPFLPFSGHYSDSQGYIQLLGQVTNLYVSKTAASFI